MDSLQLQLCDIQGRLFELSLEKNLNSAKFIKQFMNSSVARDLDSTYNRMQWAGEEYLLEETIDATNHSIPADNNSFPKDVLYWIGYIYRYWHYYTGESSKEIYKQAPVKTMNTNYLMFHTMAPELAIEDLKEIYNQRKV